MNPTLPVRIGLLLLIVGGTPAVADDTRLLGAFVNRAPSEKIIAAAIDPAVADFNFIARPIARSRLKKSNPMIMRVAIAQSGADLVITLGTQKPTTATPGGPTVKWTRDDGEVLDVAFAWEGATLVQSFKAEDGIRYNRYALSPDGDTLTIDVLLTSDQLKKPVKYQLTLVREGKN